jgi:hypothetical protein
MLQFRTLWYLGAVLMICTSSTYRQPSRSILGHCRSRNVQIHNNGVSFRFFDNDKGYNALKAR